MFKKYLIHRLGEASTIRGIIMFAAGALGLHMAPEVINAVVSVGVALSGLVGVLMPDRLEKKD